MPTSATSSAINALTEVPPLCTAVLRLTYRAEGRVHLPSPPANVWRGQLGYYLHRIASEEQHERDRSLYQRLFRTPRSAVGVPDYGGGVLGPIGLAGEHVPHPFVVRLAEPPAPGTDHWMEPGETVEVEMMLMGDTVAPLPQLTAAFEVVGEQGLGHRTEQPSGTTERGRAVLTGAALALRGVTLSLYDGTDWALPPVCGPEFYERAAAIAPGENTETPPAAEPPLQVHFRTPVRLNHGNSPIRPEALNADALAAPLYRRVVGMAVCYGPEPPTAEVIQEMQEGFRALADPTALDISDLTWTEDTRYSHRQERRHPAGGLTGTLVIEAPPDLTDLWARWLHRAERIHLGKATSMGLGRIELG